MEPVSSTASSARVLLDAQGRPYEPAVGPKLKILLVIIFASVALLGATGAYLLSVRYLEEVRGLAVTNQFTLWMFAAHEWVGLLLIAPFLIFGLFHLATARHRKNRLAVRLGIALFIMGIVAAFTGLALIQIPGAPQLPTETMARKLTYWLHLVTPVAAVALYLLHRRAGPDIQWAWGYAWGGAVGVFVVGMVIMHAHDPRKWYQVGSPDGDKYFRPSLARTVNGNFVPAHALLMDDYCLRCHADIYQDHLHSAHKFSSFNNPAYLFSVLETRRVATQRDGNPRASRWCAGCHDPVPFFSGAFDERDFDDPSFDVSKHATAGAGITCTVCHAIVNVNSRVGNADYTIEEPLHYPFAYSDNEALQWLNNQIVKAKPEFHKKTFLKPFHRSEEFCSTCHKVSLPMELNHYKEFLRGQNHSDTFLLSGVSGHGARAFYYPPEAKTRCAECHMPLKPSGDFGSRDFDSSGTRKVHNHLFVGANTGLPALLNYGRRDEIIKTHADFLRGVDPEGKDKKLRIDLFGLKPGGTIDGKLIAPLRPALPKLEPGKSYLVEVVVRTVAMGHPFTQGTVDSNEIWVDFAAKSGDRFIGRSGALAGLDETGAVDEWSHFVNVHLLDRHGNRIDRRNPQDIFTPLYNHQIPPGAAQVVHYKLEVPADVKAAVHVKVRLRYRKFDDTYMKHVHKGKPVPKLPIVDICEDEITFPVAAVAETVAEQKSPIKPPWQRWNDYGIGCLIEGGVGLKKGELRQAREAFQQLLALGEKDALGHAHLNLARVAFEEGRLKDAVDSLNQARQAGAPWWTVSWFNGLVNAQNGHLDEAIANFEKILDPKLQETKRKFDFTLDYVVINELGATLFKRAQQETKPEERDRFLYQAVEQYQKTLKIDPEDLDAHYGLFQSYELLGESTPTLEAEDGDGPSDPDSLLKLAASLASAGIGKGDRIGAGARLGQEVNRFGAAPTLPKSPKLPTLQALMQRCRNTYATETDPALRAAAAHALSAIHLQMHAIFKPDENARDRTVRLYREKHPAANHAAEAIVIYPLDKMIKP